LSVSPNFNGVFKLTNFKMKMPNGAIGQWFTQADATGDATGGYASLQINIPAAAGLQMGLSLAGASLEMTPGTAMACKMMMFPNYLPIAAPSSLTPAIAVSGTMSLDLAGTGASALLDFKALAEYIILPEAPQQTFILFAVWQTNVNAAVYKMTAWGFLWDRKEMMSGFPGAIPPAPVLLRSPP